MVISAVPEMWFCMEPTQSLASTCCAIRWAKSGAAILSIGTTMTPAQQASKKRHYPLSAVLAPNEDLVTLADAPLFQVARKAIGIAEHIAVRPSLHAITAMLNVSHLGLVAAEVIKIFQDGGACHLLTV